MERQRTEVVSGGQGRHQDPKPDQTRGATRIDEGTLRFRGQPRLAGLE